MRRIAPSLIFLIIAVFGLVSTPQVTTAVESEKKYSSENDPWLELQNRIPFPYTKPLPSDIPTAIDGTYVKFETKLTPPIPCRRCPDYKPEGGWWILSLRKGVFRIFHRVTGWKSLGTYTIVDDRIFLDNDPVCPQQTGGYQWKQMQTSIVLSPVNDRCSAGLRAKNFTNLPWLSCQPPSAEGTISGHWAQPEGCRQR